MTFRPALTLTMFLSACALTVATAVAQPTMNPPVVVGANVTFSWSGGTPGNYTLQAGVASGVYLLTQPVGPLFTVTVTAPAVGNYFVRVLDAQGVPSAEVVATVGSLVTAPAAPVGLQAYRNGTGVLISWTPGAGGGPAVGYRLRVGLTPGGAELGVIPTAATGLAAGGIPAQTYYLGVSAFNAGGSSSEAPEVALNMPAGGACDTPPAPAVSASSWGGYLTLRWTSVPGAAANIVTYNGPGTAPGQLGFGGSTTQLPFIPQLPLGTWTFGVQAVFSCGSSGAVGQAVLVVDSASNKLTPRQPDPAPGVALQPPAGSREVVLEMGRRYQGELNNSCREHGGNNNWLFRVVAELRKTDKRWGLNWKRANVGDMSQDIITYNWSSDGDEGTVNTRVYDVIGNHCGSGNYAAQFDEKTVLGSTGAKWTLIPYIQAGFTP